MSMEPARRRLRKRMPKTLEHLDANGWVIIGFKNGHIQVVHRDGYKMQMPGTPGDCKSDLAVRTRLINKERANQ